MTEWKYTLDGDMVNDSWHHTADGDYRPKEAKHAPGDYDLVLKGRKVSQREFDAKRRGARTNSEWDV